MLSRQNEVQSKHRQVVAYLNKRELDAVVLTRRCNFAWYTAGGLNHVSTAGDSGVASLLITRDRTVCLTNAIEAPRVSDEELSELGIEVRWAAWYDGGAMARVWSEATGGMKIECDVLWPGMPDSASRLTPEFDRLRWVMTEDEVVRYRILAVEVAAGLESASRQARPGMTEHELAGRVAAQLIERGVRAPVVLIGADDRVRRYRHPIPTGRRFEHYGMAVVGGERDGLIVSCSRLFSFGPIDDDLRCRHEAVCRVDARMIAATRPGRTLGDVFAVAQEAYAETGFDGEWQYHHQGGLTGYVGREDRGMPGNPTPIEVNHVYAWNPSIAGTKSEDTILVAAEANEILSRTGDWPTTTYEAGGQSWSRCDIMCL